MYVFGNRAITPKGFRPAIRQSFEVLVQPETSKIFLSKGASTIRTITAEGSANDTSESAKATNENDEAASAKNTFTGQLAIRYHRCFL
jgi:hypothetical protein